MTASKLLVTVTKVLAPNFIVPIIKKDGKSLCLADFGEAPFDIVVPLHMLAPHIETRASYPAAAPTAAALAARTTAAAADTAAAAGGAADTGPSRPVASEGGGSDDGGSEDGNTGGRAGGLPADGEADQADQADEQGMQAGADVAYPTLSTADVERVRAGAAAVAAATATSAAAATTSTTPLNSRPATIEDLFSCVIGDAFHLMDRPKAPY